MLQRFGTGVTPFVVIRGRARGRPADRGRVGTRDGRTSPLSRASRAGRQYTAGAEAESRRGSRGGRAFGGGERGA